MSPRDAVARFRAIAGLFVALAGCSTFDPSLGAPIATDDARGGSALDGGEGGAPDATGPLQAGLAPVSFRAQIRPLMDRSSTDPHGHGCKGCHYSTESTHVGLDQIGLDLATLGSLRRGGNTTGVDIVVPGQADDSKLYQKLRGTYPIGARMPRDGPPYWSDDEIGLLERWIDEGARGEDSE